MEGQLWEKRRALLSQVLVLLSLCILTNLRLLLLEEYF